MMRGIEYWVFYSLGVSYVLVKSFLKVFNYLIESIKGYESIREFFRDECKFFLDN